MSNPLRDSILKDIVEPAVRASKKTLLGEVVDMDEDAGTIDIRPIGNNMVTNYDESLVVEDYIQKISFVNSSSFKDAKPEVGDKVYVDFVDNDMSKPILLNIIRPVNGNTFITGLSLFPIGFNQGGISSKTDGAVNLGGGGGRQLE